MRLRRRLITWGGAAGVAVALGLGSLPALLGSTAASAAPGPNASLDQCANGRATAPSVCASPNTNTWVNGDLNAAKSHYFESDFVPFRALLTGLTTGAAVHTVTIQWDILQNGTHAYDYLGTYNTTVTGADPMWEAGFAAGAPTSTFAIPVDTGVGNGVPTQNQPAGQVFTLIGGTITGVSAYSSPAADSRAITVSFTANATDVVMAWSGHVGSEADWGVGNAAATIAGSAYHMAVTDLDNSAIGHQDRSLKVTTATVSGAALSLAKTANPTTYTASGQTITYPYVLTNSGTLTLHPPYAVTDDHTTVTCPGTPASLAPGATVNCSATYVIQPADVTAKSVTNTATATAGWLDARGHAQTVTSNQAQATVTLFIVPPIPPGPTFVGHPAISAAKSATPTLYDRAGQVITYSYSLTNSGDVALSGPFTVTDSKIGTFTCSTASTLAVGASVSCSNSYTITAADLTSGTVTNLARGSGLYNGTTVLSDPVQATVTALHPAIAITKTPSPTSVVLPGGNVTYTYVVTNTGDTILAPVTVTDDVLGAIGTADSLAVGASTTFTKTVFIGASSPSVNTATATGTDPLGTQVTAQAAASVTVVAGEVIIRPVTPTPPTPTKALAFTGTPVLAQLAMAVGLVVLGWLLLVVSPRINRRRRPTA